mmetsp:Transcript_8403/g.10942  ORF Transcript_8403/g.10942 Transcript_8403/m.10942 type:complete len:455 (+) Transcript_8403:399-1763(+)
MFYNGISAPILFHMGSNASSVAEQWCKIHGLNTNDRAAIKNFVESLIYATVESNAAMQRVKRWLGCIHEKLPPCVGNASVTLVSPKGEPMKINGGEEVWQMAKNWLENDGKQDFKKDMDSDLVREISALILEQYALQVKDFQPQCRLAPERGTTNAAAFHWMPTFIIIGAQKSGTTSLYYYLNQHHQVVRSRRRESHYFTWRWKRNYNNSIIKHQKLYSQFFESELLGLHPYKLVTGESTPSYLLYPSLVIPRLQSILSGHNTKILCILRNPVHRAYSHYQMIQHQEGTPAQQVTDESKVGVPFEEVVTQEFALLHRSGFSPSNCSPAHFAEIYSQNDVLFHRPDGNRAVVGRGIYAPQLSLWLEAFPPGQSLLVLRTEDLHSSNMQAQMCRVFEFLGLPLEKIQDGTIRNAGGYQKTLEGEIEEKLYEFYEPYNQILYNLLANWSIAFLPWNK